MAKSPGAVVAVRLTTAYGKIPFVRVGAVWKRTWLNDEPIAAFTPMKLSDEPGLRVRLGEVRLRVEPCWALLVIVIDALPPASTIGPTASVVPVICGGDDPERSLAVTVSAPPVKNVSGAVVERRLPRLKLPVVSFSASVPP